MRAEIVAGNGGEEILPVNYSDNYISLWPGETKAITAKYATKNHGGQPVFVRVRGYNVPEFWINNTDVSQKDDR